jgi:hypothetical protein
VVVGIPSVNIFFFLETRHIGRPSKTIVWRRRIAEREEEEERESQGEEEEQRRTSATVANSWSALCDEEFIY